MDTKFKSLLSLDIQMFAGNPSEALFYEVMSARAIGEVVDRQDPDMYEPYLGDALFPRTKIDGLELSYIKDTRGVPMVLKPSQFDVATPIRDRVAVEALSTDMPFFKEGMIIGEKERQELFNAMTRIGNQAYQRILARIYNDQLTLVEAADAQTERLRMQALTTGKINIVANGEYLEYDYGVPANQVHTVAVGDQWDNPDADLLKTVDLAKRTVRNATGVKIEYMLMNSMTLDKMLMNKQMKKLINPDAPDIPVILDSEFRRVFRTYTGIEIITYDKMYRDEEGVMHAYIPEGVVTFIPRGDLGNTNYGTTPEEFDLMNSSNHRADVSIVRVGVAIKSWKQEDPVNSKTVVSQIVMPSFEQASHVFIANVYPTP